MASLGQTNRNKQALYKPTDFASKQKKLSDNKKEEPQVVVKIQQRPSSTSNDEMSEQQGEQQVEQQVEQQGEQQGVLVLNKNPKKNTVQPGSSRNETKDTKPKVTGVADKDFDKIKQLGEFMAKQKDASLAKETASKPVSKDSSKGVGKVGKENQEVKSARSGTRNRRNKSAKGKLDDKDKAPATGGSGTAKPGSAKPESKSGTQKAGASAVIGGSRPKSKIGKKETPGAKPGGTKPITGTKQGVNPRNQNRSYDANKGAQNPNSYYSQMNYGRSSNPPWLAGPVVNNPGILKKPYVYESQVPASVLANRKTVPATKDKNEQKRSLDFVKNFFDTDPEVLHHRQQNIEKVVTKPITPVAPQAQSVSHDVTSMLTQPMYNATLQDNRSVSMTHNAQLQSLMAHNTHMGLPSTYSVYQQQQLSQQLGSSGGLHHQTSGTLHGTSAGAMHHGGTGSMHSSNHGSMHHNNSSSSYHTLSHPSSMFQHQATGGYPTGMYSQMPQSTLLSPGSNYHESLSNNALAGGAYSGMSTYSGYFPQAGHQSHVRHMQQEVDPSVMQDILKESSHSKKKWQKNALTKCGPIDSKQARSLIEQLIDGSYECMVCCESVKWSNQVWDCGNCFHIFHLSCIRKWARSEAASVKDESGWRCPGCQNVSTRPPNKYFCFCGKVRDPDWNPRDGITPHSCGEVCKKKRSSPPCGHSCNELCHPGPCPSCPVMVTKHCPCGKTAAKRRCGQTDVIKCDNDCLKLLLCGQHRCQNICHQGPCEVCDIKHNEECYCSKERRYVDCGTGEVVDGSQPDINDDFTNRYTCGKQCERTLSCGNHQCEGTCHAGNCKECPLLPNNVKYCPCGKVPVNVLSDEYRTSCLDDIPTCDSFCGKKLHCGPKGSSHLCMMKCHTGKCQPCQKVTSVQCRCSGTRKEIPCEDLKQGEQILCERKCSKKRKCGRHKCNQKCCTDKDHACNIICGKKLSCVMHKCDEVCHTGFCPPCWRAGFDELSCHCGTTVLFPPIACGAKPPECDQPCSKSHSCEHAPLHVCHSEEACPPCAVLTTKQCMGGHEIWKNIPCHLNEVSCGRKCGKMLSCEVHSCIKTCHKGACLESSEACTQPCNTPRVECGHACAAPCHTGTECPNMPCKAKVSVTCRCERKSATAQCLAGTANSVYQSFNAEILTNHLRNLQSGQSIDISSFCNAEKRPKFLDCDEECARLERNKRVAEALGIDNPEGGHFQNINFSPQLKQDAKAQYQFVQMLEGALEDLVLTVKKSSQSQIHHAFPAMNVSQRKIVHEMAEAYGCKTYSQDQEPKRSTVVMASKESIIPNVKLSTLVERELMKANPPPPVFLGNNDDARVMGMPIKPILKNSGSAGGARVDYFDDDYNE